MITSSRAPARQRRSASGIRVRLHVESLGESDDAARCSTPCDRRSRGVEIAADGLRLLGDLADAARRRPLEEHVLEDVRDTDDVVGFIEVAGVDVRDDRHDGRRMIAPNENGETVRETRADDRRGIDRGKNGRCHERRRGLGARIRIREWLRLTGNCARCVRVRHRRAPRPRSRSGAVQKRSRLRNAPESSTYTPSSPRRLVRRVRLRRGCESPRQLIPTPASRAHLAR